MQGLQVTSQWAIVPTHNAHNTSSFIWNHDDDDDHDDDEDDDDDHDDGLLGERWRGCSSAREIFLFNIYFIIMRDEDQMMGLSFVLA